MASKTLPEFDKYEYYNRAVQSEEEDAKFLKRAFEETCGRSPRVMREDFCAAYALCCAWAALDASHQAIGIDLEEEPLSYGKKTYLPKLDPEARHRVTTIQANVLAPDNPRADLICALNFSYFIFKDRSTLKLYFERCFSQLNANGALILDAFGGIGYMEPNEHETEHDDFSYFWDQDSFDPATHHTMFYIHFKRKGEKKREQVFSYDWRLWTLPELTDLLVEVGFEKPKFYWEGSDEDGDGNGVFEQREKQDDWDTWLTYLVARKP